MKNKNMKRVVGDFRSISTLMLQRIIALAVVCLILIGGFQVWMEREKQERQFLSMMALIVETSSYSMANVLWDIEDDLLNNQLQRLAEVEAVGFVRVKVNTTGDVFTAGRAGMDDAVPSYEAKIYSPDIHKKELGTIEIWADKDFYMDLLWQSQKNIVPGYIVFTLLMCAMVAWVMRRDLGMPLRQIADFVSNLRPEALNKPLEVTRPERVCADEIDMVMQGFHHLQQALNEHIKNLDGLVKERTLELLELVDEVKRLSQIDSLTGAHNRRAMEMRLPLDLERSERYGRPFSVIFADIDHFKRINDQHGHSVGDAVLKDMAQRLRENLRANLDWMVRFGGEEFVIFMPETSVAEAKEVALRLAQQIRSKTWREGDLELHLSCSFGVASYRVGDTEDTLLKRADAMLYVAKKSGRDCVRVDE